MHDIFPTLIAPCSGTFPVVATFPYSLPLFHSQLCSCQPWIIDNPMRSWALGVWVLCICLIMISERVTLLKPLSRQHPPLIPLNPPKQWAPPCRRLWQIFIILLRGISVPSHCQHNSDSSLEVSGLTRAKPNLIRGPNHRKGVRNEWLRRYVIEYGFC